MMRRELFLGVSEAPPELRLRSSALDGALAVAAGEAIWRSIEQERIISVAELLAPAASQV